MEKAYFITGTDTNAGKTWAAVTLIHYFKNRGKAVVGMKPVASGCINQNGELKNADALLLQAHSNVPVPYKLINPYAYELAVSPHLAGRANPVSFGKVTDAFKALGERAEIVLVEGAGGWHSPITDTADNGDLAKHLNLPVILVVGIKLGCLNHARLTYQAIASSEVKCAGWIAMCLEPQMLFVEENIGYLRQSLTTPLLGVIPYNSKSCFELWKNSISV